MKTVLKTAPEKEPVDLDDVKDHLRVDIDDDDDMIESMIIAARELAENITQRKFITQTWYLYFDNPCLPFPPPLLWDRTTSCTCIEIPFPPVQEITAFEYQETAGSWTAVDSDIYYVDAADNARLILTDSLPTPEVNVSAFRITFITGYGDGGDDVPNQIRLAINTFVLHFYEHREAYDFSSGAAGYSAAPTPQAGSNLLDPYKIPRN